MISSGYAFWMTQMVIAAIAAGPAYMSADGCKISEYADHIEVVCVERSVRSLAIPQKAAPSQRINTQESSETIVQKQPTPDNNPVLNGAQASRKRSQLEAIRTLNSHRFDTTGPQPPETD